MGRMKSILSLAGCLAIAVLLTLPGTGLAAKSRLAFSGGPEGGTFQYFSNGISTLLSKNLPDVEVSNMASAGSVENLRRVNSGDADFGITYSGDLFLARNGKLPQDAKKYENVLGMAYLYGAPAHLVVLEASGINDVAGLAGKKVAVGGAGSGAAASAERYFKKLGVWDKMQPQFIGYSEAVSAMGDKLIDAVWVFAGFPNASVIQAAASNKIKVLDTVEAGQKAGFFDEYPFYTEVTIPAGTYSGVDAPVKTFQDSALWVTGKHVKPEVISAALKETFSPEGLAYLVKVKSTAKAMSVEGGLNGIVTPIHPGAEKFWTEKGLTISERQKAQ
ncbi:TAXI family TRAP transporter solute-binding subunit [Desulfuromonas sp. TF]|uniref:TAXI family TRAP transporter solute-binding subunit n=1 Tax=Desulfuromonas sp. TF TaxID=1232410 RepID=UPI000419C0DC|nr:TAXI family TRAP transporter solute-binding subunit [Desulfuromonas sp. TF]